MTSEVGSSPQTLLGRARRALTETEQAEVIERGKLLALVDRERHVRYAMEQTSATMRIARDAEGVRQARLRVEALDQERQVLLAARRAQEEAVDRHRDLTRAARLHAEELDQRAAHVREAIRHAEHLLTGRQRSVAELEGELARVLMELPRVRGQHAEAQARLAVLLRELAELDGG